MLSQCTHALKLTIAVELMLAKFIFISIEPPCGVHFMVCLF